VAAPESPGLRCRGVARTAEPIGRRRCDAAAMTNRKLTGITDVLADVEHRADEVNRRATALLAGDRDGSG
jgi:hypothetical protein